MCISLLTSKEHSIITYTKIVVSTITICVISSHLLLPCPNCVLFRCTSSVAGIYISQYYPTVMSKTTNVESDSVLFALTQLYVRKPYRSLLSLTYILGKTSKLDSFQITITFCY